jgi:hypothetical protein
MSHGVGPIEEKRGDQEKDPDAHSPLGSGDAEPRVRICAGTPAHVNQDDSEYGNGTHGVEEEKMAASR